MLCNANAGTKIKTSFMAADAEESDDGEEESDEEGGPEPKQAPQESLIVEGGRTRRRALFADHSPSGREAGVRSCY